MHTITLVTVDVPEGTSQKNETQSKNLKENLIRLAAYQEACKSENANNIVMKLIRQRLNCTRDAFSASVDDAVAKRMAPYAAECDPQYCEFHDETEETIKEYESGTIDCIKEPSGKINPSCFYPLVIRDGKVFARKAGPLHHEKRTKKSKKYTALPAYPIRKLFSSLKEYAEEYCELHYDEEKKAYGYLTNPNAFWDWYSIGGRWPLMFLVKSDCKEFSIGEREFEQDEDIPCPEGYKWAVAARKKDIEWNALYEWRKKCATERFLLLEEHFKAKTVPEGMFCTISEKGMHSWNGDDYLAGETLEEYLHRCGFIDEEKYHAHCGAFVDLSGKYHEACFQDAFFGKYDGGWNRMLEEFLDEISDEAVIVAVDCHM